MRTMLVLSALALLGCTKHAPQPVTPQRLPRGPALTMSPERLKDLARSQIRRYYLMRCVGSESACEAEQQQPYANLGACLDRIIEIDPGRNGGVLRSEG